MDLQTNDTDAHKPAGLGGVLDLIEKRTVAIYRLDHAFDFVCTYSKYDYKHINPFMYFFF